MFSRVDQCDCKEDQTSIIPGHTWRHGCNRCQCLNGKVTCKPTIECTNQNNPTQPCEYTPWTAWTPCNITACFSEHGRQFRFRSSLSAICDKATLKPTVEEKPCIRDHNTVDCNDIGNLNCEMEGEIQVGNAADNRPCQHCVCTRAKKWKCMNICEEEVAVDQVWSKWTDWSSCSATCYSYAKPASKYRHRVCLASTCNRKYHRGYIDMDVSQCSSELLPKCDDNERQLSNCELTSMLQNFTLASSEEGKFCMAENIKVNICEGGCKSRTVLNNIDPYITQQCDCCSYKLDKIEPIKFIDYKCPGDEEDLQGFLPNIAECVCIKCGEKTEEFNLE